MTISERQKVVSKPWEVPQRKGNPGAGPQTPSKLKSGLQRTNWVVRIPAKMPRQNLAEPRSNLELGRLGGWSLSSDNLYLIDRADAPFFSLTHVPTLEEQQGYYHAQDQRCLAQGLWRDWSTSKGTKHRSNNVYSA